MRNSDVSMGSYAFAPEGCPTAPTRESLQDSRDCGESGVGTFDTGTQTYLPPKTFLQPQTLLQIWKAQGDAESMPCQTPPSTPKVRPTRLSLDLTPISNDAMSSSPRAAAAGRRPPVRSIDLQQVQQSTKRSVIARPTCTHVSMVKVYNSSQRPSHCHQCGRVPALGFLYACDQDALSVLEDDTASFETCSPPPPTPRNPKKLFKSWYISSNDSNKDSKEQRKDSCERAESKESGQMVGVESLNQWTQEAIARGHYTQEQIDIFVYQKAHLIGIIAQSQAEAEDAKSTRPPSPKFFDPRPDDRSKSGVRVKSPRKRTLTRTPTHCDYKVCHSCRPNSRDKTFLSLDSIFADELDLPTQWDPATMPVHDVNLVRNIGLRPVPDYIEYITPSPVSGSTASTAYLDTPRSRPASWSPTCGPPGAIEGMRNNLRRSLIDTLRARLGMPTSTSAPPSPSSTSTESAPGTDLTTPEIENQNAQLEHRIDVLSTLCTNDAGEFDINKWRQMSDEVLAQAARLPLSRSREELDDSKELEDGHLGLAQRREVREELDEEDMNGVGLRLTEEAAENDAPDVIVGP